MSREFYLPSRVRVKYEGDTEGELQNSFQQWPISEYFDDCGLSEGVIKKMQQISVLLLYGAVAGELCSG